MSKRKQMKSDGAKGHLPEWKEAKRNVEKLRNMASRMDPPPHIQALVDVTQFMESFKDCVDPSPMTDSDEWVLMYVGLGYLLGQLVVNRQNEKISDLGRKWAGN